MADNWYLILELEFDPKPVEDMTIIEKKIDEKAKFWSSNFNHFQKGPEYRRYHQMISDIRKAMSNPDERKRLIQEAVEQKYGPIDKLVRTVGRKGEITEDEIEKIALKQKTTAAIVRDRVKKLSIKIGKTAVINYEAIYDKYYKTKPEQANTYEGLQQLLKSFNVDNLYSFLYKDSSTQNANKLHFSDHLKRAAELKKTVYYKNDSISGSGSKLCGQCELTFKDEASKELYDKFLEYQKRKAILDEVKNIADVVTKLGVQHAEDALVKLTELFKDYKLAQEVLMAFCKVENIAIELQDSSGADNSSTKICRACGTINNVTDGRTACQKCAIELHIKCPKCETVNDANINYCKCGFDLGSIDRAIALCDQAEYAMKALDFQIAEAYLTDAERLWPGNVRITNLQRTLSEHKQRVGVIVEEMREAAAKKRYYEARKQYEQLKKMFLNYSEHELEQEITNAIDSAQNYYKQAQSSKNEAEVIECCVRAYELCSDFPGIQDLIAKHPPTAPTNLKAVANGTTKENLITWNKSAVNGTIVYIIVRKLNSIPLHIRDGELLARQSMCSYNDSNIVTGKNYYYSVFAERAGAFSQAVSSEQPVINLFEITNATITAGDAMLQLEWSIPPAGASVEVYSVGSGREQLIATSSSLGYLINGLKNDTPYCYKLKLAYHVNGNALRTQGVTISGTPTKLPNPIEALSVRLLQNDIFEASWAGQSNAEASLYCSTTLPKYKSGDLITQADLEQSMQRLPLTTKIGSTATFQYKGADLFFVVAVVLKAGSAVIGATTRAGKGELVKINDVREENEKINIYIDPPKDATGFVVLYRFDEYPIDISDTKTVRKYIPLKYFLHHKALIIESPEKKDYYFSIFAEFARGEYKDYSPAADFLFVNSTKRSITYSIRVTKRLFGENTVTIAFEAEQQNFMLPDIDIFSAIGNTPMFKDSAQLFHTVSAQQVDGELEVKIAIPKGTPKDFHIKAFFKNDALQANNQLKLKFKSNYKIT